MSKQVDERVVSMQFDNSRFEKNVQTSMSTLDKLKQKLNLTGATKGLETVQSAAKKVDMTGLANNVETVRTKFSALEVMGVTALANITNSAVNAGKRMISALTIDPIKTGFQEYETQMNAVQTILANTQSKGSTLDDVNKALDTLNTYADKTIYNFTEMTRNIGTFTAAGVDLQTSVDSIQGIANLAAVSGSSSQQASTAMYQLSQALAAGRVSLMDWNSVVNAGMGGELFQKALLRTSELLKTGGNEAVKTYGSFRESLTKGQWLTTEVLTETLKQLSGAYSEADLVAQGFTKEQAKEIASLAETATNAATKVKTFSQLWEVMKESAQSGWAQTWKLIIGDFEEAKSLLTPLADFFTGIIGKMSDARNKLLESALGKTFTDLGKKIKGALEPMQSTAKAVGKVADAVKDYGKIVDEIIGGEWGNGQARWDKLTKAGYDWAHAQNLVNEKLGDSTRHATKYKEAQDATTKSKKQSTEASGSLTKKDAVLLEHLIALSDEELKLRGYTDDQIAAFRELEETSKKLGIPIRELIENIDQINGRWLIINSFKNIGSSIVKIFKAIGDAWRDAFPPMQSEQLFTIIAGFHRFSTKLKMSDETAENLTRTLKGVFAILDIVLTIVGGPLKIAFKILSQLLGAFDLNILDLTAIIGDAIVKFRDWIDKTLDFTKVFEKIAPYVKKAASAIGDWVKSVAPLDKISNFFKKAGNAFKEWADGLKETDNIPKYIIQGLVNGLKAGVTAVGQAIAKIGKVIIDSICNVLGIHSPSKEMEKVGKWTIEGFLLGIQNGASKVWNVLKNFGLKCIDILKNIDIGAVIAAVTTIGMTVAANKIGNALVSFASTFEGLGDFLEDAGIGLKRMFTGIGKWFKAGALEKRSKAILNFAIAIGILAASVYVLAKLDVGSLWGTIGAIGALAGIILILSLTISKINIKDGIKLGGLSLALMSLSAALLIISKAIKTLGTMESENVKRGLDAIFGVSLIIIALIAATNFAGPVFDKAGWTLLQIAAAITLMAFTIKQISKLDPMSLTKGTVFMVLFGGFIVGMIAATKLAGPSINGLGATIFKISAAILLLALTARIIGGMDTEAMVKGTIAIIAFGGIVSGLIWITKLAGGAQIGKIGSTIFGFSAAMLVMAVAVNILGRLDVATITKGTLAVTAFGGVIAGLVYITKYSGATKGLASTILAASVSIGILAAVSVLLGLVKTEHLVKGIIAVGLLVTMMAGLILATKGAQDCKGNLIVMTVAIGILAAAIAGLSFIDPQKLAVATVALGSVMGMFALMIKSASALKNVTGIIGPLSLMVGVVIILAGVITALSALNVDVALSATAGLSLLMLSLSASLVIISIIGKLAKDAFIGIGAFATLAVSLFILVGVLATMDGLNNAMVNANALTLLVTAMSLMLIPLSLVGAMGMAGLPFIGVGALATLAVSLFIVVGLLATMEHIQNAEHNANLLTRLMVVMTAVLIALSIVGPLALAGVGALAALSGLMLALGVLAVGIGALMEKFPAIQSFLDTGIPVLIQLAGGIGKMIGAFVGGIASELAASLPSIGTSLSQFMENAKGFIDGAKLVDESVAIGAGILVGAILALTVAEFINGLTSLSPFMGSFADLGTQLSKFMVNAMGFIAGARMIDPAMMEGVKSLASAILVLTGANMIESITRFIGGESSLATFGSQLGALGTNLRTFVTNLGTFSEDQVTSVKCAGNAIKALADAASTIPNEGGWIGKILGENSLATFGSKLPQLGTDLKGFITNLGTFTKEQVTTVDCAGKAIKALAEAANEIPNEGGFWAKIVGDNSLATFGSKLPPLATNIKDFVKNLGTFGEDKIATVNTACKTIKSIAVLGKIDLGDTSSGIEKVGKKLVTFAKKIKSFADEMSKVSGESLSSATTKLKDLINVAKSVASTNVKSLETFGTSLKKVATEGVKGFVQAFTGEDPKAKVTKAAKSMLDSFIKAAKGKKKDVNSAFEEIGKSAASKVATESILKSFETSGKNCVKGFVNGIKNNKHLATDAGSSLGKAALKAAKAALDENSPSKEMYEIGDYAGIGFVNALYDNVSRAYKAGTRVADSAKNGISKAVSRIADIVNSDIDTQPTIRPVLDLSNVKAGAGSISSLFTGRTLAVDMTGIGSVSATMSYRQNGNGDVVSAIKGLRKDIANMPRNSYTFGNMTVEEGSDMAEGMRAIVRAMKVEGRA